MVQVPNITNLTSTLGEKAADAANSKVANITANLTERATDAAGAALSNSPPGALEMITLIPARYWQFISSPFTHPAMQWIIIPLLVTFLLSEFYFFRHPDEELGWNAALMNSLVLIFVAIDMTKTVFEHQTPVQVARLFIASLQHGENLGIFITIIFIGLLGVFLAFVNYFHLIPRRLAFLVSSHASMNFIALTAVVTVYTAQAGNPYILDVSGVIASVLVFTTIVGIIFFIQRMLGTKDLSMYSRRA